MKQIALTFDDGPNEGITNLMLEKLEKYKIPASFFIIANCVKKETEYLVKKAFDMGCEIQNHSMTHTSMIKLTKEQIEHEITFTSERIKQITGVEPKFFRPPFVDVNQLMFDTIPLPFICGIHGEDWIPAVSSEDRAKKILNQAKDGSIILLHDFPHNEKSAVALDTIIPTLKEQGFEFLTISKLFEAKNVVPTPHNGVLYSNTSDTEKFLHN